MTAVRPVFDPPVFVPAATAERHIAEADAALSALTDEVRRTEAAAAALEGAVGVGFDLGALEFVVVRFDRFVRGLLAETATEIDALVAAVQRRRAPVPLSWDHLFVTDPVVEPGPVAVAVAVVGPGPVAVAVPVVEPGPVPVDVAPPASPAAPVAAATRSRMRSRPRSGPTTAVRTGGRGCGGRPGWSVSRPPPSSSFWRHC
jgi:hypothetical protein